MLYREAEAVERGHQAVILIYNLTSRVPGLIEQSHLEKREGKRMLRNLAL